MAVDKKSEHYTTSESYTDLDGQYRQFTMIDCDKKTSKSNYVNEDKVDYSKIVAENARNGIEELKLMPAICYLQSGTTFGDVYTIRDKEKGVIWNEKALNDLVNHHDLRAAIYSRTYRYWIKEEHWFEEYTHEEFMNGIYKPWIRSNLTSY